MTHSTEAPAPRRSRRLGSPLIVAALLVGILAGLGASVAVVAGIADGVRAAGQRLVSVTAAPPRGRLATTESMQILTADPFGPRFTHPFWTVRVGETVTVRITNFDTGTAPLTGAQTMFDRVGGTLGGIELVDGRPITSLPNDDVAHTFTVVGLGVNLPIPVAPTGGSVTVVARFVATRAGRFVWQCYAPCGSGSNAMGGPMSTMGWMEGTVRVRP